MARVSHLLNPLPLIDIWGLRIGDIVNNFRTRTLGLTPLTLRSGSGLVDRVKVPWTYCMSPALVPKPEDWKNHIGKWLLSLKENSFDNP